MYFRRVVKKRPASLTEEEWCKLLSARFVDPGYFQDRDGYASPPVDVDSLLKQRALNDLRWRLERLCMAMVEPSVSKKGTESSSSSAKMGGLLSQFSELWEFLSGTTYASGKKRQTGHLSLRLDAEGVKVTLTDPTSHSYCTRVAETLDDALLLFEVALKDGTLKWLPSSYGNGKK